MLCVVTTRSLPLDAVVLALAAVGCSSPGTALVIGDAGNGFGVGLGDGGTVGEHCLSTVTGTPAPVNESCRIERFEEDGHPGWRFRSDGFTGGFATLSLELFALDAPVNTALDVADGADPAAGRGCRVSFVMSTAFGPFEDWTADTGDIIMAAPMGAARAVKLSSVHLVNRDDGREAVVEGVLRAVLLP
jgi:hypothetical protein